jgi:adenosine deaminase
MDLMAPSLHVGLNETQSPLSNGAPFQKRNFFTDRRIDMLREAILKELSRNSMEGSLLEDLKKAWFREPAFYPAISTAQKSA